MKIFRKLGMRSLAAAVVLAATAAPAFADKQSEAYVQANANTVLKVLADKSLTDAQRESKFSDYMNKFAHMPTIARRVLGVNARSISQADFDKYYKTFEVYAMETYEVHFDQFRGEALRVTGSKDEDDRRSTVATLIKSSQTGKDTKVFWDVLKSQDGQSYRVRDVGIDLGGSVLWLAQEQQAQFESYLNRNGGSIDKLIGRINVLLADMEARKKDGRGSAFKQNG
ncbi:MAG TPA: ABC transporter substrate-binding protein [Hyphomonadaceae bacterium]|jgi:phospholipid transport system substrate-binding protein|nr:ABC transporter substrate-binding protein [Hyphomonadaceae bacterium]